MQVEQYSLLFFFNSFYLNKKNTNICRNRIPGKKSPAKNFINLVCQNQEELFVKYSITPRYVVKA
jgi:hypothetical protein